LQTDGPQVGLVNHLVSNVLHSASVWLLKKR